jgi:hypothetical protein
MALLWVKEEGVGGGGGRAEVSPGVYPLQAAERQAWVLPHEVQSWLLPHV